jgi:hypothetical protein
MVLANQRRSLRNGWVRVTNMAGDDRERGRASSGSGAASNRSSDSSHYHEGATTENGALRVSVTFPWWSKLLLVVPNLMLVGAIVLIGIKLL